jgi:hypothetical protein
MMEKMNKMIEIMERKMEKKNKKMEIMERKM